MRRKPGTLMPLEMAILDAGHRLCLPLGQLEANVLHGFHLAKELSATEGARLLTSRGTIYRALGRLESMGLLKSVWEGSADAAEGRRIRRKYYALTRDGIAAREVLDV